MLNVVAIMGRLVSDPSMRQTPSGKSVASVRIACDRGRKDANGQMVADFFDVVCWEKSAEFVCKYFRKGSLIAIDGRLQSRNYTDKYNNNRTAIEIVASNINFSGSKVNGGSKNESPSGTAEPPTQNNQYHPPKIDTMDSHHNYSCGQADEFQIIENEDDLPF